MAKPNTEERAAITREVVAAAQTATIRAQVGKLTAEMRAIADQIDRQADELIAELGDGK